jgi:type I restriction enzyme S subunit
MSCVPELRFKEFNGEWEEKELCEVSNINPNSSDLPDNFIYIDLESVESGILKQKNEIQKENAPSRAQRVLEQGNILFQTVRPYQKNNLFFDYDDDFYVSSTGYAQLRAIDNPNFLFQIIHLGKFVIEVLKKCTGTSYPAINSTDLKKIKVNIPKLEEQEKIANFLSKIDEKITILENKLELWNSYKKGVMQQLFSQQLRFKDENGNSYPDWESFELNKIADTFTGLFGKTKEDFGEGSPFITYKSIFDNVKIDVSKLEYVNVSSSEKQNNVQYGDIFFTTSSETPDEVGMASVFLDDVKNCYLNSFCFGFRLKDRNNFSPEFLGYFFRSPIVRNEIKKIGTRKY